MTAIANCLACGVAFLTIEAWDRHLTEIHAPRAETVCVLCERPVPTHAFAFHPCVGTLLSARAAHPSAAEPNPRRDEPGPVSHARHRLRLVCTKEDQ